MSKDILDFPQRTKKGDSPLHALQGQAIFYFSRLQLIGLNVKNAGFS